MITPVGIVRCVYDETISLSVLGQPVISRGSYVEPDAAGRWYADLAPVDGPKLEAFLLRSEALQAERDWLEMHWLATVPFEGVTRVPADHALRSG